MADHQVILITGAGGFVGHHLVETLQRDLPASKLVRIGRGAGCIQADMTDHDAIDRIVADTRPDRVIHLAALSSPPAATQDPERAWAVNLLGTLGLGRAIMRHCGACSLVYASSSDVYGRAFACHPQVNEAVRLDPVGTYGATKAAADLALGAMAADGLRCVRLRLFNHTGPGQRPDFVVPAFARQVARIAAGLQAPVVQVGALDVARDFLDIADVCAAYMACITQADALPPGQVINIASATPRRIGDILKDLLTMADVSAEIVTGQTLLRRYDIPTASGDASLARRLLGWAPRIPWHQTLRSVLDDWRRRIADSD